MDTFAHGLLSYIFFFRTKKPWLAVFFGIMPDLFSWTIFLIFNIFTGQINGRPHPEIIPDWTFTLYGLTHSFIIMILVFGIVYMIVKKIPLYLYAWPIHVLIDIPTHSREFLPTPFLWPVSEWYFPGISWASRWVMIPTYLFIILGFSYIAFYRFKKKLN